MLLFTDLAKKIKDGGPSILHTNLGNLVDFFGDFLKDCSQSSDLGERLPHEW
jgi:hypothetical protein